MFVVPMNNVGLNNFIPITLMLVVALGFVATTMIVTHLLGPKRRTKTKDEAFECGIESQGNARVPYNIKYFMVALLVVLFDVEVIFMYPWAVNFEELQTTGFVEMLLFLGCLMVGFFYILKKGALKWDD
jgi:NADH-quinone oxidoreductase subunit A